jgi:hypothetical protein
MFRAELIKILGLPAKVSDKAILERARVITTAFTRHEADAAEASEVNRLVRDSVGALSPAQAKNVRKTRREFAAANPRLHDMKLPLHKRLSLNPVVAR